MVEERGEEEGKSSGGYWAHSMASSPGNNNSAQRQVGTGPDQSTSTKASTPAPKVSSVTRDVATATFFDISRLQAWRYNFQRPVVLVLLSSSPIGFPITFSVDGCRIRRNGNSGGGQEVER